MLSSIADSLAAVRQPAYTGENRCLPCTAVNVAIAAAVALVLIVGLPLSPLTAVAVGFVVFVAALAVIAVRGYLVPGTPHLTKTYLPDRFLRHFEHAPPGVATDGRVDPAAVLEAAGAVTECDDIDDLCLTDEFRAAWTAGMDAVRGADRTREALASMLELPADAISIEEHEAAVVATVDRRDISGRTRVGQWESPAAFLADMAAAGPLRERVPGWTSLSAADRGRVLGGLRIFLEACPGCGGPVTVGEETVESCCRSKTVVAISCADCGDRLFEADHPPAG